MVKKLKPQDAGRSLKAPFVEVGLHTGSVGFVQRLIRRPPLSPQPRTSETQPQRTRHWRKVYERGGGGERAEKLASPYS